MLENTDRQKLDDSLLHIIEPIMIMVLGGIVGGMIVAMYLPIFKIFELIN